MDHSHGDARRLLALLRHAVQRAEEIDDTALRPEHLRPSNFEHVNPGVEEHLAQLSSHHRMLYHIVHTRVPISGPELEAAYRRACEHCGLAPVSPRTLVKYLGALCQRRILEREHGARTSGWVYRVAASTSAFD